MRQMILVGLLLLLVGCGGGSKGPKEEEPPGDPDPRGDPLELKINVAFDSYTFAFVPPLSNFRLAPCPRYVTSVGDMDADSNGVAVQPLLFFNLATLPAGSSIESAVLRLYQNGISGTPFSSLGSLRVLRVEPYGDPCLTNDPIGGTDLGPGYALLTSVSVPDAWHEANVAAHVGAAWSEGTLSLNLTLEFSGGAPSNSDDGNDAVLFVGPRDSDVEKRPVLVIEYYPPD